MHRLPREDIRFHHSLSLTSAQQVSHLDKLWRTRRERQKKWSCSSACDITRLPLLHIYLNQKTGSLIAFLGHPDGTFVRRLITPSGNINKTNISGKCNCVWRRGRSKKVRRVESCWIPCSGETRAMNGQRDKRAVAHLSVCGAVLPSILNAFLFPVCCFHWDTPFTLGLMWCVSGLNMKTRHLLRGWKVIAITH